MSNRTKQNQRMELREKLNTEIKDIEKQIKKAKYQNVRTISIKSLKVFKHATIAALPIVLSASLIVGVGYILGGGLPFIRDDIKQKENIVKEITADNYRVERHFANLSQNNQLLVSTNWTLNENNTYQRQIDRYNFEDYTEEDIINVIESGDLNNIVDIIGTPYSYVEEKTNLTEDELQDNKQSITATLYSVNDDNVRVFKESSGTNVAITVVEILIWLLIGGIATVIVWSDDGYDPIWKIKKTIRESSEEIDVKMLRKQLAIRTENLNRITR